MTTSTVRSGAVTIPVEVAGDGPPAVFVPGLFETQAQLGPLFDALRRVFRLATFDLRGHGVTSAADSYDYSDFAGDVRAVVDELGSPDSMVLLGHSLGADLALDLAAALPAGPGR